MADFCNLNAKYDIENLPVIDLNKENVETEWSHLISDINDCTFLALDIVSKFFRLGFLS